MGDFSVNPLVLLGMGSSFAFSGLFYRLYQEKKKEIQQLKEIPIFKPDQHLLRTLKASPYRRLQYVAVEGVVIADDVPLSSQYVPRCFGVIQSIALEEHWKYRNSITNSWGPRKTYRKETNTSVPFSLVSPGVHITNLCMKVKAPLEASGCLLETVHHRVRHREESFVDSLLDTITGEKPIALEETEKLLRIGSIVTGFGEVALEGGQVMSLQAPQNGRKYILESTDYKSFMNRQENSATMWMTLTAVSGITGVSLLASIIYSLMGRQNDRNR